MPDESPSAVTILLAGSSGIPGRNILASFTAFIKAQPGNRIKFILLKRTGARSTPGSNDYTTACVDNFADTDALAQVLREVRPNIVISALNAEPAPVLDNYLIDAMIKVGASTENPESRPVFFINGFTLDLLHSSVAQQLPTSSMDKLDPKISFAHRLMDLAHESKLEYCTIVCAAFLDYCLMKGYSGMQLAPQRATLFDSGKNIITGCSLDFVGDAVCFAVQLYMSGNAADRERVINKRLRIAETRYSGRLLLDAVQRATGTEFEVTDLPSVTLLERGSDIGFLNWNGLGAATFEEGLEFGHDSPAALPRRSLDEIVLAAIQGGVEAFDGIGR